MYQKVVDKYPFRKTQKFYALGNQTEKSLHDMVVAFSNWKKNKTRESLHDMMVAISNWNKAITIWTAYITKRQKTFNKKRNHDCSS
jgi:CHAD domain-containing protein